MTLEPGDLIFTGTPGTTKGMQPGDVVTVEIEGVGVLEEPGGRRQALARVNNLHRIHI